MIYQDIDIDVNYEPSSCKKDKTVASLTTYILDDYSRYNIRRNRVAVLICPGGGYEHVSRREGEPIAIQMNAMGHQAFVLNYSITPNIYPTQLLEVAKAIMIIREHAKEWDINPDKIVVAGFSAGGHLAASIGAMWQEEFLGKLLGTTKEMLRPNGLVLCYPVITSGQFAHRGSFKNLLGEHYDELIDFVSIENRITKNMPNTFLWHTLTDGTVPVENSFLLLQEYRKHGIPIEFHLFPEGHHGLALASEETSVTENKCDVIPSCQRWIELVRLWLKKL